MTDVVDTEQDSDGVPVATMEEAKELMILYLRAGRVVMLKGSPGVGKSKLMAWVANQFRLFPIDVRLSTMEPPEMTGYPYPDLEAGKMRYLPTDLFPLDTDPIPDGYKGWALIVDELNACEEQMQAASFKFILDRMIGLKNLHPNAVIMCAGNLDTDGGITTELSTPMQSRLAHIRVRVDHAEFIKLCSENQIDYRIIGYLNYVPADVHRFDPNHTGDTYPCPRTWFDLSDYLKLRDDDHEMNRIDELGIAGIIGHSAAFSFIEYCGVYKDLITLPQIIADPDGTPMPTKLDALCAIGSMLAAKADMTNMDPIMKFLSRMPVEFQFFTVKDIIRREKSMFTHPAVVTWKQANASFVS